MASWILVPCLVTLRNEFNSLAPSRDKSSDGSIGDSAHASSSSDHNPDETGTTPYEDADNLNEVHAIDVDIDLRKSGWTMARAVDIIVTRHRTGADDRLQNVIYNRRIYSRSWGWTAREYTGSNPHDKHAHFSSRYTTAQESNTKSWGLLAAEGGDDMEVKDLNAALRDGDSALAMISKAIPWQYVGGGIPEGMSTLGVLSAIHGYSKSTNELVKLLSQRDDVDERAIAAALAPAVAGLVTPALIDAIEAGGALTPEAIEQAVEAGTRAVLRAGVDG